VEKLLNVRKHGISPYTVAVIHGGPGACGELTPVASELAKHSGVLEPWQTKTSIEGQIQELKEILIHNGYVPITLIGHSWGAWLSYIFTARYPSMVRKLILVSSSSPFEDRYSDRIMETRWKRLNDEEKSLLENLIQDFSDKLNRIDAERSLLNIGKLMQKADSFNIIPEPSAVILPNVDVFRMISNEASELRRSGELLQLGKSISCPVVAIHGDYDPHPYQGVQEPLGRILESFRMFLLTDCGHDPWLERSARNEFFDILKNEIFCA
jgi:pimeloyl-ACP methyl ester carboxylesterase